ncbi:MAG: DUF4418 family protein [Lachnospiraceae bacterium]|nr:DUF4418 family protein [Lachnospiraceae bacterium]
MKNRKIHVFDIVILILFCFLAIGVITFLGPCGVHEDGSYSSCHWAGRILFGLGIVGILEAVLAVFLQNQFRLGVNAAVFLQAVLMVMIPGKVVSLCGMSTMRCNLIMKPGVQVISLVIALLAAMNLWLTYRWIQKEK